MKRSMDQLKWELEQAYERYARPDFIEDDPIQIPAAFDDPRDKEVAGLLAATIAWGQRKTIIRNAQTLMQGMDERPHQFVTQHEPKDLRVFERFVHRTFQFEDLCFFMGALQQIYRDFGSLESAFTRVDGPPLSVMERIDLFRNRMLRHAHLKRSVKHLSSPAKNSSAKRLNMFLRWMVRSPKEGIDFGIWTSIHPSELMIPLDVHTGTVSRKLGILHRAQMDWKSVEELTKNLRKFDPDDPVKYDFSLFGMGVNRDV